MAGEAKGRREDLNLYSEKPMMLAFDGGKSGIGAGGVEIEGLVITEWKDIPMELLLRIVSLVDDRTLIMASGVCSGWRDAICSGLTHLCLSWYNLSSSVFNNQYVVQADCNSFGIFVLFKLYRLYIKLFLSLNPTQVIMPFELLKCFLLKSLYVVFKQSNLSRIAIFSEAMIENIADWLQKVTWKHAIFANL
jgi:hypothetical protein